MRSWKVVAVATGLVALTVAAVIVYFAGSSSSRAGASVDRPDILLITLDTLRADHVGAYGHDKNITPTIDALAQKGVLFEQATTPFPRTTPGLASLLTGLWPQHHGSREVGDPMDHGKTLAQLLRARGYATRGVSANPVGGKPMNLDRGFDAFAGIDWATAGEVTDRALRLAEDVSPSKPLFLWVHYWDPHWPYEPPDSWKPQPEAPRCRKLKDRLRNGPLAKGQVFGNHEGRSERALEHCKQLYDAEIAYNDAQVGRLLEGLRERRGVSHAYTVLTSDHGEHLGEEGLYYEHGPSVHDVAMRVPLIFKGPGIARGHVDDGVARLEDVMPTLLSELGVPDAEWPDMDGRDLSAKLHEESGGGNGAPPEVAFAESGSALQIKLYDFLVSGRAGGSHCINWEQLSLCDKGDGTYRLYNHEKDLWLRNPIGKQHPDIKERLLSATERWAPEEARQRTARTPRFKLVKYPKLEGGHRRVLYDLSTAERRDVSDEHPDVVRRLESALQRWSRDLPQFEAPQRSKGRLEQLRALGYVE